jgi:N-acetylneuraminic acid mutarotase
MKTNNRFKTTKITFVIVVLVTAIVLTSAASARAATWTQKADMPTARWNLSTSVVDGKIYAIGGLGGLKKVEEYNPATDTWTEKADMPTGRIWLAASAVDGKIYAIGGRTTWYGGATLATVEEYDPATDTWTQKADMPAPRDGLFASVVNGKIYAIGGWRGGVDLSTVEEYDPATDTWTTKADMPTARWVVSTSVVNGKIYAVGGLTTSAGLPTVEEYDPVTDTWTKKADMPVPGAARTSVVDKKIYAFGGTPRRGGAPVSTLLQYDPATDAWTVKDDMPVRMLGMGTSAVGGRIYVIGGSSTPYPYSPFLSTVWEYDIGLRVASPDINGDGIVDDADISIMVDNWHMDEPSCDVAPAPWGDGIVDVQDLIVLSEYLTKELNDPTLVAHWALDEAEGDIALDSVSENNGYSDRYVIGNPVWQPTGGLVDGAIQLDGVDDYIIAAPVLNPASGPFSVLAWVKGGAPGQAVISESGGVNWLSIDPSEGSLMTELKAPGRSGAPLLSQTVITDDNWHRIGLVWDGLYRTLYVDSIAAAQDTQDGLTDSANGLYIGTSNFMESGTYFSGLIDDVRIYNRVVIP